MTGVLVPDALHVHTRGPSKVRLHTDANDGLSSGAQPVDRGTWQHATR
jgi:hypothetical protein